MSSKIKVDTIENVAGSGNVSLGSGHNLVVPGDLSVDTNVLKVDSSNNKVGINTTSPSNDLHISSTNPVIRLQDTSTNAYAQIFTNDAGSMRLRADAGNSQASSNFILEIDGTTQLSVDSSGRVTKPNQPSFAVWGVNNDTGFNMVDATLSKLQNWSNTHHNVGNHFNTTTGTFTAPVDGVYFFYLNVMFRMNTSTYINDLLFRFKKNNADYITTDIGYNDDGNGDGWNTETLSSIIKLSANDTVDAHYFLASTTHSTGDATNWYLYNGHYTQFHGHLLG